MRAVTLPRVGEYVHGLGDAEVWYGRQGRTGGPYSAVAAVEHAPVPAFKAKQEGEPSVRLVVWALWPGDGPMAGPRMLAEYDAEGWTLQFVSEHAPVERLPGQPLM